MSDEQTKNVDQGPEAPVDSAADLILDKIIGDKNELALEDVDQFLNEADPEFAEKVSGISKDKTLVIHEFEIDSELQELQEVRDRWQHGPLWKRVIFKIVPVIPQIVIGFGRLVFRIKAKVQAGLIRSRNFSFYLRTTGKQTALNFLRKSLDQLLGKVKLTLGFFKELSWKKRALFALLVGVSIGAGFFIKWMIRSQVLTKQEKTFVTSLDDIASGVIRVPKDAEFEKFYDNLRAIPNIVLLPRMIMVVQPSPGSARQPMVAIQLYLEAWNPDVIVEIKDREAYFRDFIQRHLESQEFKFFEQVNLRSQLLKSLMNSLNRAVTTGQLRSIKIKNIVLMPSP